MTDRTQSDDFIEPSTAAPAQELPAGDLDAEFQEEAGEQAGGEHYEPGDYSGGRERLER